MSKPSYSQQQTIIEQQRRITKLSSHEYKVVERILVIDGSKTYVQEEDFRIIIVQSVEVFASLLMSYFDDRAQNYYSNNIVYLNGWFSEIREKIKDKHFIEVYDDAPESSEKDKSKTDLMLAYQVRKAKEFFLELNLFIQRTNLLSDSLEREVKKNE